MRRRITTAKREEIEKEQKLLDSTIVRPFETLEGLPISYNPPPNGHYEDVLKNPLTIKDSAVLYNSLVRSRNTYVQHAPMFKLYWVKQTAYAKKLAEMEKDKDAFRERESRRRFAKATTSSLETRNRTPVLSTDVNARDVMSKLCESSITLGPHSMDIRIFIAKDARSEKSRAFAEISRVSEYQPVPQMGPGMQPMGPTAPMAPMGAAPVPGQAPALYGPVSGPVPASAPVPASGPAPAPAPTPVAAPTPIAAPTPVAGSAPASTSSSGPQANDSAPPIKTEPKETEKDDSKDAESKSSQIQSGLKTNKTAKSGKSEKSGKTGKSEKSDKSEQSEKSEQPDSKTQTPATEPKEAEKAAPPPDPVPKPPPPPPANLQSIDNLVMISNLNAIAKIDLSLNDLMKVVALGAASEAQITLFKKYIERAKQMGPQPHHAELYYSRNLPLPPNFPRPRQYVERRPPRPKIPNPLKLTAFQEKYLHNATLVFEFLENPNVRYVIPRDSICEVLEAENPPKDAEEDAEFKDILLSHVWIHNIDEVEAYEKKLAAYNAEIRRKEEEEKRRQKEIEEAEKNGLDPANVPSAAEERSLRAKKRPPPPKKKKNSDKPEEPAIRFSTLSFTLHNIPIRFVPIVLNSMKPLPVVYDRMTHILKNGTRVPTFYLWYQVDARLDERVAENLRRAAVLEEKKMQGVMPQGSGMDIKKRKREWKNPKLKRVDAAPSYAPVSMAVKLEM